MPELLIDIATIGANTESVARLLADRDLQLVAVTKGCLGEPRVAAAMLAAGATALADSRDADLRRLRAALPHAEIHRLGLPRSGEQSHLGDLNYITSWQNAEAVARADAALDLGAAGPRRVVLQVETGDEREGIPADQVVELVRRIVDDDRLEFAGVATNYGCMQGGPEGLRASLQAVAQRARDLRENSIPVPRVSGGNSSVLWLLAQGEELPSEVTELRCGEALLLGHDALYHQPLPGCREGACRLRAEVVEEYTKPAADGSAARLVLALGHQDMGTGAVEFVQPGLREIGRTADYLVVEAHETSERIPVGTKLEMIPGYEALATAWMSPYVDVRLRDS